MYFKVPEIPKKVPEKKPAEPEAPPTKGTCQHNSNFMEPSFFFLVLVCLGCTKCSVL